MPGLSSVQRLSLHLVYTGEFWTAELTNPSVKHQAKTHFRLLRDMRQLVSEKLGIPSTAFIFEQNLEVPPEIQVLRDQIDVSRRNLEAAREAVDEAREAFQVEQVRVAGELMNEMNLSLREAAGSVGLSYSHLARYIREAKEATQAA